MRKFSIGDIEAITGIKAHTIRIWEQRYHIVESKRTSTNIRYYDDGDLCLFLNISSLLKGGLKISEVSKMSSAVMQEKVRQLSGNGLVCQQINLLTDASLNFKEDQFCETLMACLSKKGVMTTMSETVFPFMRKLGLMWQTGIASPAHEHFASELIKRHIVTALRSATTAARSGIRFMLFLPEKETHEIGLLFADYLLTCQGHQVLYLGQNIPYSDLESAACCYMPHYCLTCITSSWIDCDIDQYVQRISATLAGRTLVVCGPLSALLAKEKHHNVICASSISQFETFLAENVQCCFP